MVKFVNNHFGELNFICPNPYFGSRNKMILCLRTNFARFFSIKIVAQKGKLF